MGLPPHDPFAPVPFTGVDAARGITCLSCEYDLTGLDEDGDCPECGRPIVESIEPPLLVHSSSECVRRVRNGLRLVFWTYILSLVLAPVASLLGFVAYSAGVPNTVVGGFISLTPFVPAAMHLLGWNLITSEIPSMPHPQRRRTLRIWIMSLLLLALIWTILSALLNQTNSTNPIGNSPPFASTPFSLAIGVLNGIGGLSGLVLLFLELAYLRRIAEFVPDKALSSRFRGLYRVAMYGIAITMLVSLCLSLLVFLFSANSNPGTNPALVIMLLPILCFGLAMIIFYIVYLIALYQLGSRARDSLAIAKQREKHTPFASTLK